MYRWFPEPVWLEEVLTHEPPRWLPAVHQLRPAPNRRSRSRGDGSRRSARAFVMEVGPRASHGRHASLLEPLPILKKTAGTGSQPWPGDEHTIMQVADQFAPSERLTVDFSDLDAVDARHRERPIGRHLRRSLQRSVGRLLPRTHLPAAVFAGGGPRCCRASADPRAAIEKGEPSKLSEPRADR